MDKEIAELDEQISKSINEISKDFELKYHDFVPNFLGLAECQEKIQLTIKHGNEQLKKLELQLAEVEKAIDKAKEEAPNKKQMIIQDFLDRLDILSEMERCLSQLWMLPIGEKTSDPLVNVRIILRLEELHGKLDSEAENNLEAINERIMPLMFTEIEGAKRELSSQLDEFYKSFLRFTDNDRLHPPAVVMQINVPDRKVASDSFSAMKRLGLFDEYLEKFVDAIWEQFCMKLIYGEEKPEQIMKISTDKFTECTMSFEIAREVPTTKKPSPNSVFGGLTKLFEGLEQALRGIRVDDRFFVDLFGASIAEMLISSLEKGCLNPAIPFEKVKATIAYTELTKLTQDFLQLMKELGFFMQPVDGLFHTFFNSFERISVDRRCLHHVVSARDLIKKPYIDLVEVGSAQEEENEEKATELARKAEERGRVGAGKKSAELGTRWDEQHTKLFQFQRCKISRSTFELLELVQSVLSSAAETDSDLEACRLLTTGRNIVEMFITTAPVYHEKALNSVPQIAAVFFNNCHFICHRLMTLPTEVVQNIAKVSKISQQNCAFTDMLSQLRTLASATLEQHICNGRRQLSASIGERDDIFQGLRTDQSYKKCQKTLNACCMQIEQTANVWAEVMSNFVLAHSLGALSSHLLALLVGIVLRKEDITSSDAEYMADLLDQVVNRVQQLLTIDGRPMVQKVCEKPYYQLKEIIFCLKGSLAEIDHRWCQGKGPLATWLEASEVKQLIRAIFQNTDRRAQLLAQIN